MSDPARFLKILFGLGPITALGVSFSFTDVAAGAEANPPADLPLSSPAQAVLPPVKRDTQPVPLASTASPNLELDQTSPPAATFVRTQQPPGTAQDLRGSAAPLNPPSQTAKALGMMAETIDYPPYALMSSVTLPSYVAPPQAVATSAQGCAIAGATCAPKIAEALGQPDLTDRSPKSASQPTQPNPPDQVNPSGPASDPELGNLRLQSASNPADPELGNLLLQEIPPKVPVTVPSQPPPPPRNPSVYLQGRLDYFKSNNVFSSLDTQADGLIRSGLTLFYAPALGKKTYLITSIDGNLIRYGNIARLNYNELRFRAGLWQQLSPTMSGEIGWSSQKLYTAREGLQEALKGERFFNDNSIRFELSRADTLTPKLTLSTFYQLRMSFASPNNPEFNDPLDRSRLINTFVGSLNYNLSPSSVVALDYQYAWSHYTQQAREDHYHQVLARFTYTFTPTTQFNVFGGYSFGASTESLINYNSFIFGVGLSFNLPLF